MPFPLLYLYTSFNYLSGAVAILVSFYAFRYTRILENSALRYLSFGFLVLGLGLLAEAMSDTFSILIPSTANFVLLHRLIVILASTTYSVLEVVAYLIIMLGYLTARRVHAYTESSPDEVAGTSAITRLFLLLLLPIASIGPFAKLHDLIQFSRDVIIISALISMALVAAIVYQDALGYLKSPNKWALLVLASFTMIFVSEVLSFTSGVLLSDAFDVAGTVVQFVGFLSLLIFLLWRSKIGPARKATQ